jgi:hypothetical protein
MGRKRSRFAMLGIAALSLCLAIGLASGAAEAKKKGKKKSAKQVTVSRTTPTAIPPAPGPSDSLTAIPLTVGKVAKGKVVSGNSVKVTFSITDPDFTGTNGDTGHLGLAVQSPSGRQVFLDYPDDHDIGTLGPLTLSPDSSVGPCEPSTTPPPPPCENPEDTLPPPFAGTIGFVPLAWFTGAGAKGTWQFKVFNDDTGAGLTLNSVSLNIGLQAVPKG